MKYIPPYYTLLFDCVKHAIEVLREQDYVRALDTLTLALRDAEDVYLDVEGKDVYDEESPTFAWELVRVSEDTRMLKIRFLIPDDPEAFRRLKQEKQQHPEDGDSKKDSNSFCGLKPREFF